MTFVKTWRSKSIRCKFYNQQIVKYLKIEDTGYSNTCLKISSKEFKLTIKKLLPYRKEFFKLRNNMGNTMELENMSILRSLVGL